MKQVFLFFLMYFFIFFSYPLHFTVIDLAFDFCNKMLKLKNLLECILDHFLSGPFLAFLIIFMRKAFFFSSRLELEDGAC